MYFSYSLLLLSWILMIPAIILFSRRGERSYVLMAVVGMDALYMLYITYWTFIYYTKTLPSAPIRIDIFGLIMVLSALKIRIGISGIILFMSAINAAAGVYMMLRKSERPAYPGIRLQKYIGALICLIAANAVLWLLLQSHKSQNLQNTYDLRKQLEFQTMFRDSQTIKYYFGNLTGEKNGWAGHYAAVAGERIYLTRIVINSEGHVWLFWPCHPATECVYLKGNDALLTQESDAIKIAGLKPKIGMMTASLELRKNGRDRIIVSLEENDPLWTKASARNALNKNLAFMRTPPPSSPLPKAKTNVNFLGVYSSELPDNAGRISVLQIWLWQSGDRVFGRYLRGSRLGTASSFLSAKPFTAEHKQEYGKIDFRMGERKSFSGNMVEGRLVSGIVSWQGRQHESLKFQKKELIPGFFFQFAPLANEKETLRWLDVMSISRMIQ